MHQLRTSNRSPDGNVTIVGHVTRIYLLIVVLAMAAAACSPTSKASTISLPPTTTSTTAAVVVVPPPDIPPEVSEVIEVTPGMDLELIVQEAPPGATIVLEPGVHRGFRLEPKDGMTFIGTPGATMNGAAILEGLVPDGEFWRLDGVANENRNHGECQGSYRGCSFTQDLFFDNVQLWQVTDKDDLEPGAWFREGETIFVADDPTHRTVEISVVSYAFVGSADDVTIRSLAVEKYATPAQEGTIQSQEPGQGERGNGWVLEDLDVSLNHGAGIRGGDNTLIRRSHIHHNGQLGITGAGGTGLVIEECEIAYNNTAGFRWEWEAGGVKVTNSDNVTFTNNVVHHNIGPGLWSDIDVIDTLYQGNKVFDNVGPGIFHEISGAAVIRDNVVERNGRPKSSWLWGAGILVAGSWDVEVFNNVVSRNGNGIAGIQQNRGSGPYGERLLRNLYVHNNTIELGSGRMGIVEDVRDDAVFEERNNRFATNTYVGDVGRAYLWMDRRVGRTGWMGFGQDVDGVWVDK